MTKIEDLSLLNGKAFYYEIRPHNESFTYITSDKDEAIAFYAKQNEDKIPSSLYRFFIIQGLVLLAA